MIQNSDANWTYQLPSFPVRCTRFHHREIRSEEEERKDLQRSIRKKSRSLAPRAWGQTESVLERDPPGIAHPRSFVHLDHPGSWRASAAWRFPLDQAGPSGLKLLGTIIPTYSLRSDRWPIASLAISLATPDHRCTPCSSIRIDRPVLEVPSR
jgi:hypothetical protein